MLFAAGSNNLLPDRDSIKQVECITATNSVLIVSALFVSDRINIKAETPCQHCFSFQWSSNGREAKYPAAQ